MPWCENDSCGKRGLKKDEVVFDEKNQKLLCVPCAESAQDQSLVGELVDKTWFGVGYTSDQGLKAEVVHGGARLTINVSNEQFSKLLGQ